VSASYGNTAEETSTFARLMERNRAVVSALLTPPAALLAALSFGMQQCSSSGAPQRGLCPGLAHT